MSRLTDNRATDKDPRALTFNAWALARGVDPFELGERDDYESLERLYSLEDEFEDECQAALDAEVSARSPARPALTAAESEREQKEHRAWCEKEGAQLIAAKRWDVVPGDRILIKGGEWIQHRDGRPVLPVIYIQDRDTFIQPSDVLRAAEAALANVPGIFSNSGRLVRVGNVTVRAGGLDEKGTPRLSVVRGMAALVTA